MKPLIVVVDDEKAVREVVARILSQAGYEVIQCENAIETLEKVRHNPVDLIVSDIQMHGINGIELLERAAELDPYVPTILITGHGTEETARKAAERGAAGMLSKPIEKDKLLQTVESVIKTPRRSHRGAVLLVDDDEAVRDVGRRILEKKGYRVELARDGEEAVEKAREGGFEIVIMDVVMPRMTGVEATKKIKALDNSPTVIISSGQAMSEDINEAKRNGAFYSVLAKPYEPNQLVRTVRWVQDERRDGGRRERPHYTDMLQVRKGPSRTTLIAIFTIATLFCGVLFSFLVHYAGEATGTALKPFKAMSGYFQRIEEYLKRDEDREIRRDRGGSGY